MTFGVTCEVVDGGDSEDMDDRGSDEDDDEPTMVKVKFGSTKKRTSPNDAGSRSARKLHVIESDSEDDEDDLKGRGSKRTASVAASGRIAHAAKRLRGDSKENESSESSNDATYNSRKRSLEAPDSFGGECPKRTRLQRMNTNNKVENGELDNVLLDKLISDVMKQSDAWPFLKPVTRAEVHNLKSYS
jgi:hypothetical protein